MKELRELIERERREDLIRKAEALEADKGRIVWPLGSIADVTEPELQPNEKTRTRRLRFD